MFEILRICGPAAGGVAIGWLAAWRGGLPFGRGVARPASCLAGLALPYLVLAALMAGLSAGAAAALGVLGGVVLQCAFKLQMAISTGGRFHA